MWLINLTKEERLILNNVKSKILKDNDKLKNLTDGKTVYIVLKKYLERGKSGR